MDHIPESEPTEKCAVENNDAGHTTLCLTHDGANHFYTIDNAKLLAIKAAAEEDIERHNRNFTQNGEGATLNPKLYGNAIQLMIAEKGFEAVKHDLGLVEVKQQESHLE